MTRPGVRSRKGAKCWHAVAMLKWVNGTLPQNATAVGRMSRATLMRGGRSPAEGFLLVMSRAEQVAALAGRDHEVRVGWAWDAVRCVGRSWTTVARRAERDGVSGVLECAPHITRARRRPRAG